MSIEARYPRRNCHFSSAVKRNCSVTYVSRFLRFAGTAIWNDSGPGVPLRQQTHSEALAATFARNRGQQGIFCADRRAGNGQNHPALSAAGRIAGHSSRTVFVFQTQCTSREFIEYILQELGVDTEGMGLVAMHGKLNEILFEELLAGKRFVLVVDEAQNLDDSVLETVRMLSNFETHNAKLLQIILAGQPRLAAKLAQPRLSQLRQRIAVLSHLEPFTVEETAMYIWHRLKVAGCVDQAIFDLGRGSPDCPSERRHSQKYQQHLLQRVAVVLYSRAANRKRRNRRRSSE